MIMTIFFTLLNFGVAHAQDKVRNEITHEAEFRLRDVWDINQMGSSHIKPNSNNLIAERFRLDLGFRANERLGGTLSVMNNFNFGGSLQDGIAQPAGADASDFLTVNQAFASWMMSDEFTLKLGRMNYQIDDGALIATNEYEPIPYAFDGLLGSYEAEFGRIQAFGFKLRALGNATSATPSIKDQPTASDGQRNAYGVNFDLKLKPEIIKSANAHIVQDQGDALVDDNAVNFGRDITRYGAAIEFEYRVMDFKLWYEGMNGKYHILDAAQVKSDISAQGTMLQAELGARWAGFVNSRFFFRYHMDTGTKDSSSVNGARAYYDPYFNETHCAAGCMDLFGWGNLTSMTLGWTMTPLENTDVGLNYWMFSKTAKAGTASVVATTPASGPTMGTDGKLGPGQNADRTALGSEVDLWIERHFNSGLTTTLRLGEFFPGEVYKASGAPQGEPMTQVFAQVKLVF